MRDINKPLEPFKFWAQKVLPLVYDDSLSYYEVLCKVVEYLNETIDNVDNMHTEVTGLHEAYVQLQNYVNTYFDNLDVQAEINAKLDEMATDGSLSALISPLIPPAVTEWLDDNITPTSPIIDASLTVSGAGADAKITGDKFKNVSERFNDISKPFINVFNANDASIGYYADKESGALVARNNFYVSDFIPVNAEQNYRIHVSIGSNNYATVVFYNSNKEWLGASFNDQITAYTITTPVNCSYIRVNGASARINEQMVTGLINAAYAPYRLITNGYEQSGFNLFSENPIFYDDTNGILSSKTAIILTLPDAQSVTSFGTSVNVGVGRYLFYDITTFNLFASENYIVSENRIFIAFLTLLKYDGQVKCAFISEAFPIFNFDAVNNTLTINVKHQPAYIIYNAKYYALNTGFTQTITLPNLCDICFDPSTNEFFAGDHFRKDLIKGIPIGLRYYRRFTLINGVVVKTPIEDIQAKVMVCYGDSLTWYDGHEFTWGPHEGETCVGFETYVLNELNLRYCENRGESGKTTPQICDKIVNEKANLTRYDIMSIMGGDNDDRLGTPIGTVQPVGSTFDTTTIAGALQNAIEQALGVNPSLRIVLMTEPMGWTYESGALDRVSETIPQTYRNVAKQYGLPIIDNWNESGINELNRNTFYADPVDTENTLYMYHPNNEGWKRISKNIVRRLKEIA